MLAAFVSLACGLPPCFAQADHDYRVGRIIIEGNTDTPDRYIRDLVPLRPGAKLNFRELRASAERLRLSQYFVVNPWQDIVPTVEILPNELDSKFLDIRIRIQEKPLNWLRMGAREVIYAAAMGDPVRTDEEFRWLLERGYQHFTQK